MPSRTFELSATIPDRRVRRWARALVRRYEGIRLLSNLEDPVLRVSWTSKDSKWWKISRARAAEVRNHVESNVVWNFFNELYAVTGDPIPFTIKTRRLKPWTVLVEPRTDLNYASERAQKLWLRRAERSVRHIGPDGSLQTEEEAMRTIWANAWSNA